MKQIPSSNSFDNNQPGLRVGGQVIPLKDIDTAGASNGDVLTYVSTDGEVEFITPVFAPSALTDSHIFVGDGANVPQDVAMTGDVSIDDAGVTTIANGAVTASKIGATFPFTGTPATITPSASITVPSGTVVDAIGFDGGGNLVSTSGGTITISVTGASYTPAGTITPA